MKDDVGCIIIVVIVGLAAFLVGILVLHGVGLRRGYIACLSDIQNNRPMRYVLKNKWTVKQGGSKIRKLKRRINTMSGLYVTVYTSGSLKKRGPIRLTIHDESILPFNKLLNLTGLSYIEYVVGETFSEVESPLICMGKGEGFNVAKSIESKVAQFGVYAWVKGLTQYDIESMYPDKDYARAYLNNVHIIDRYLPENLAKEYHIEGVF